MQLTQTIDESALVRAAQTDAQAFGALYDRYIQRVYRYCYYRTNSPPEAEDLTAQIFLAALEGLSLAANDDALRLPVLGRVGAGVPIGADISGDSYVLLDRVFFSPAPDYLLKVKGDSMRDEGIFDGDLIGVHRTRDARSGQIVVARVDDEVTVKLLKISQDRIRLLPRNPDYAPIDVQPDQDFAIEGLYCGLVRPNR